MRFKRITPKHVCFFSWIVFIAALAGGFFGYLSDSGGQILESKCISSIFVPTVYSMALIENINDPTQLILVYATSGSIQALSVDLNDFASTDWSTVVIYKPPSGLLQGTISFVYNPNDKQLLISSTSRNGIDISLKNYALVQNTTAPFIQFLPLNVPGYFQQASKDYVISDTFQSFYYSVSQSFNQSAQIPLSSNCKIDYPYTSVFNYTFTPCHTENEYRIFDWKSLKDVAFKFQPHDSTQNFAFSNQNLNIPSKDISQLSLILDKTDGAFFGNLKSFDGSFGVYNAPINLTRLQSHPSISHSQIVFHYSQDGYSSYIVFPESYVIPQPKSGGNTLLYKNIGLLPTPGAIPSPLVSEVGNNNSQIFFYANNKFSVCSFRHSVQYLALEMFSIYFSWFSVAFLAAFLFYKLVPTLQKEYLKVCTKSLGELPFAPRGNLKQILLPLLFEILFYFQSVSFLFAENEIPWVYDFAFLGIPSLLSSFSLFELKNYQDSSSNENIHNSPLNSLSTISNVLWVIVVPFFLPILIRYFVLFFHGSKSSFIPLAKSYIQVLKQQKLTFKRKSLRDPLIVVPEPTHESVVLLPGETIGSSSFSENDQLANFLHSKYQLLSSNQSYSPENNEMKTDNSILPHEYLIENDIEDDTLSSSNTEQVAEHDESISDSFSQKDSKFSQFLSLFFKNYLSILRVGLILSLGAILIFLTVDFHNQNFTIYFCLLFGIYFCIHFALYFYLLYISKHPNYEWAHSVTSSTVGTPLPVVIFSLSIALAMLATYNSKYFSNNGNVETGFLVASYILVSFIVILFLPTTISNIKILIWKVSQSVAFEYEITDPRMSYIFTATFLPFLRAIASVTACTTVESFLVNKDTLAVHWRNGVSPDAPQLCFSDPISTTLGFFVLFLIVPIIMFIQIVVPLYSIPTEPVFIGPLQNASQTFLLFFLTMVNFVVFPSNSIGKLASISLTFIVYFAITWGQKFSSVHSLNIFHKVISALIVHTWFCGIFSKFVDPLAGSLMLPIGLGLIPLVGYGYYRYSRGRHPQSIPWKVKPFFEFQKGLMESGLLQFFKE